MSKEFTKHDKNKLQYNLLDPLALEEIVKVLTFGAIKYDPDNWRLCEDTSRYIDACYRHIEEYRNSNRSNLDNETNIHHLAHAATNLIFILGIELPQTMYMEKNNLFNTQTRTN